MLRSLAPGSIHSVLPPRSVLISFHTDAHIRFIVLLLPSSRLMTPSPLTFSS